MADYWLILIGAAGAALALSTAYLLFRRKPDDAERERRRLRTLSVAGRITGGEIGEVRDHTVYYSYEVAGVGYDAAQDLSAFPSLSAAKLALLSGPVTIRYSRTNPGNSMVFCDSWSGLPFEASAKDRTAS
ncbi:MAG: hypothetical protein LC114_19050 [Bryobacterales bacterium]|nr:hypothetical protein [Bryobacterales bacterium]